MMAGTYPVSKQRLKKMAIHQSINYVNITGGRLLLAMIGSYMITGRIMSL